MRDLKNYLSTANEQMKKSIIQFLKDNSRKTPKKELNIAVKYMEDYIRRNKQMSDVSKYIKKMESKSPDFPTTIKKSE